MVEIGFDPNQRGPRLIITPSRGDSHAHWPNARECKQFLVASNQSKANIPDARRYKRRITVDTGKHFGQLEVYGAAWLPTSRIPHSRLERGSVMV